MSNKQGSKSAYAGKKRDYKRGKGSSRDYSNKKGRTYDDSAPNRDADKASDYKGNHISWYVPDTNMLNDAGSIPFSYRVGDRMPASMRHNTTTQVYENTEYTMPGFVTAGFTPLYGDLYNAQSAGNVSSTAMYSWIRHANSGSRNYDSVDLMQYMIAVDNIFIGINHLQRIMGAAMYYNMWSTYAPQDLVEALGCKDFVNLISHMPGYRTRLNSIVLKISTLAVPSTLPIFQRHSYLSSYLFADENNVRAQYYAFVPRALWAFEYDEDGAGILNLKPFATTDGHTIDELFAVVESCVDTLYGNLDSGIMSGDILKAYGEGQLIRAGLIPQEILTVPVYDYEMLVQLHNATIWSDLEATASGFSTYPCIRQNNTDVVHGPYLVNDFRVKGAFEGAIGSSISAPTYLPFDIHGEINAENVMRFTRLQCMVANTSATGGLNYEFTRLASEIINDCSVWRKVWSDIGTYTLEKSSYRTFRQMIEQTAITNVDAALIVGASSFSLMPLIYIPLTTSGPETVYGFIGSLDKVTPIAQSNLEQLHTVAMLGEFNVPRMSLGGTVSNS